MAAQVVGTVIAAFYASEWSLKLTLWVIILGTSVTLVGRAYRLIEALNTRKAWAVAQASIAIGFSSASTTAFRTSAPKAPSITR